MDQKLSYSLKYAENRSAFVAGTKAGVPIGLGYFAVAFSLGIAAANAGVGAISGAIVSLLCNASAGEYAGFMVITTVGTYAEMIIMSLIANLRYILMSFALSQRVNPRLPMIHRFFMGLYVTDEIFAVSISRPGYLNPAYTYGAAIVASPAWALGTALGCLAGQVLPLRVVSALSVALYGMFLAIIIPAARKSKVIFGAVAVSFLLSFLVSKLPVISEISGGTRTIILTIVISAACALLFPHTEEEQENAPASKED